MDRLFARFFILSGILLLMIGLLLLAVPRIPWLGKLPGDLRFTRNGVSVHLPLATCLLLSLLLTAVLRLVSRR